MGKASNPDRSKTRFQEGSQAGKIPHTKATTQSSNSLNSLSRFPGDSQSKMHRRSLLMIENGGLLSVGTSVWQVSEMLDNSLSPEGELIFMRGWIDLESMIDSPSSVDSIHAMNCI